LGEGKDRNTSSSEEITIGEGGDISQQE
jgi:hypothetical protein